jgi:putative ABC transport system ATP-binding protein
MPITTLQLDNVTKVYHAGDTTVRALDQVNLELGQGELALIMGPSGAGKSTLLTIAGTLLRPTGGNVIISGVNATALDESRLPRLRQEKIGFIFQNYNLIDSLTASQNIELVLGLRGLKGGAARRTARELLTVVGLEHRQRNRPRALSGGEKQRVAIARALANNPDLILADEPTANLDSQRGREIMLIIRMIARELGKAVLAVSHDQRIVDLADRVVWLEDGHLTERPLHALQASA